MKLFHFYDKTCRLKSKEKDRNQSSSTLESQHEIYVCARRIQLEDNTKKKWIKNNARYSIHMNPIIARLWSIGWKLIQCLSIHIYSLVFVSKRLLLFIIIIIHLLISCSLSHFHSFNLINSTKTEWESTFQKKKTKQ